MKRNNIWISIGLWVGLYLCWVTLFRDRVFTVTRTLTVQFCYLLFVAANYYAQLHFAIPKLLNRKRYLAFALFLPAAIAITALLRTPLAIWLQVHFFRPGSPVPDAATVFRDSFLNIFIWVIFLVSIRLVLEKIWFRQYLDNMEKQRIRNELDFLKAQFNPHFLFNSINSIYGHIDRKNGKARTMLLSFSEMLRYQLYECDVDNIVIEKEVQYIRNYVALQQERKDENLEVVVDIPDDIHGFTIAPLLLITFVENAFKYVSNHEDRENTVVIALHRDEGDLLFRAYNTKDEGMVRLEMEKGGIGIANARRRLDLQYPGRHQLEITDGGESFEVRLRLNIKTHVAESRYSRR
ncbi:MAG TPA: sensor histidine kinase [Puia sp.]|uniref:sensor histidine kinase n=1 Tax=Puia sp. TaxID=2045100 RepID=UPI002C3F5616|nr:sensor histidine kinase [Puia sp.]HVU96604.1 sensor histidine kinase [Puia sp.]